MTRTGAAGGQDQAGFPKNPRPARRRPDDNGLKALALLKERVGRDKIIEGWVEGPIAEGADLRGINTLMLDFFDDPAFVHDLFEFVVEMELRFARAQSKAGADVIGIGDAAASLVGPEIYDEFVWYYEKQLVDGIHALGGESACTFAATHANPPGHRQAGMRHRRSGLPGADRRRPGRRWARTDLARQPRPGERSCATAARV